MVGVVVGRLGVVVGVGVVVGRLVDGIGVVVGVVVGRLVVVVGVGVVVGVVVGRLVVVIGVGVVVGRLVDGVGVVVGVVVGRLVVVIGVGVMEVETGVSGGVVNPQHVVWHANCTSSQSQTPTSKNTAQLVLASAASGRHLVVGGVVDVEVDLDGEVDGADVGGRVSFDRQHVDLHANCTDSQAQSPRS